MRKRSVAKTVAKTAMEIATEMATERARAGDIWRALSVIRLADEELARVGVPSMKSESNQLCCIGEPYFHSCVNRMLPREATYTCCRSEKSYDTRQR